MGFTGGVGPFLLRKAATKSIRQKYQTGPQFYKRKFFNIKKGQHVLDKRVSARQLGPPHVQPEHEWYKHHGGDVAAKPVDDFTYGYREDKAQFAWKRRGSFQVFQVGGKTETFVCFRCGYPVRSKLQVIKDDNWDWRMCYPCYQRVVATGMERHT